MARALAATLLLVGLTGGSCHASEAEVVGRTEAALRAQAAFRDEVQAAAANETAVAAVEQKLQAVPGEAAAKFRDRREVLERELEAQQRVTQRAVAEGSLNESDAAVAKLQNISDALDGLDAEQLRAVRSGLRAACEPTVRRARETRRRADRLEHVSHRVLDPLYSMGDRAEDRADGFNDQAVDAKDAAVDAVDALARRIEDHARDVQEHAEEALADAARARHRSVAGAVVLAGRTSQRLVALEVAQQLAAAAPRSPAAAAPMSISTLGVAATSALVGAAAATLALGAKPWRRAAAGGARPLLA